ncbi:MAG: ImmA/IrrE family metallo-endopeptidase [Planctomycetes bacterium]|nr:ImmA/IrrE family metallo-endopeptidase [Planctomycetota bacterium]MCC7397569.1 ImmA/IrrE family metallo-endopeptidase [Planctomycetota bacterium]
MKGLGDRTRFALAFELLADPDHAGLAEDRATWARFELWVAGRQLTSALAESGVQVLGAEVPLAPVLRWLFKNWDALFHEERLPRPSPCSSAAAWRTTSLLRVPEDDLALDELLLAREEWWQRHAMGAALPGFRIPDLHVRRLGQRVELSWTDQEWRTVPRGMQVLEAPGALSLPAAEVAGVFCEFATAVLDALVERGLATDFVTAMQCELAKVRRPDRATTVRRLQLAAGQGLAAAAARLRRNAGVVEGSVDQTMAVLLGLDQDAQSGLVTELPVPVLMYRSASPALSSHDLQSLLELAIERPVEAGLLGGLQSCTGLPQDPAAITQQGLQLGYWLREQMGLPASAPLVGELDLEAVLLERLGVDLEEVQLNDEGVDGVAAKAPGKKAVIAVNRSGRFARTAVGRRMTIAHELCHLLFDVDEQGRVGVVSNPWAPYAAERRANAFAVMLLLPESALEARLTRDASRWTPELLREVMRDMGVGRSTLTWQLYNLEWISDSERLAWADAL